MRTATLILLAALAGCGRGPAAGTDKKITWDEYRRMDAEQKDDPYVLDNLSDDAKARLAGSKP